MADTDNLTILFVDMVGFTERTSSQSREQNRAMLQAFNRVLLTVISGFGGRLVKSIGDAHLVSFRSPTDGVRCGMAMIDAVADYSTGRATADQIHIRVALNVGEVRIEGRDVFGEAVNVAARVEGLTPPDEIYFTEAVYLAMNKAEVPSEALGESKLKGIPEPVRLFRVPPRQINRLVPGGEDLGQVVGELPFGGMHRFTKKPNLMTRLNLHWQELPELGQRIRHIATQKKMLAVTAGLTAVVMIAALIWIGLRSPQAPRAASSPTELQEALQAGHEAFKLGDRREAVAAYARALELNPDLKNDPTLANNLVTALSYASEQAIPVIRTHPSPVIVEALARRTGQPGRLGGQRAAQLLEEFGEGARTDKFGQALIALQESGQCQDRLKAVRQLRVLRDRRAIPALREVSDFGLNNLVNNSCLRSEAGAALRELERR
ncbi:MAG: adenylate/guanylate cyclase domain-containing protein [Pseudomonadota bacterium]